MRTPCIASTTPDALYSSHGPLAARYTASPTFLFLIHAWCVDVDDRVVDNTLQNSDIENNFGLGECRSATAQYFGLVFPKEIWPKGGGQSMLDSGRGFRIDLWLTIDPGFEEVLGVLKFPAKAAK